MSRRDIPATWSRLLESGSRRHFKPYNAAHGWAIVGVELREQTEDLADIGGAPGASSPKEHAILAED
jgi:hypothetical protein